MADKKISVKIAIDGEAKYREAIKGINSENKTLNAQMKQLEAVFNGSINSYDALSKKAELLTKIQGQLEKKTESYSNLLTLTKMSLLEHASATDELREKAEDATTAYERSAKSTELYKQKLDQAKNALESYKQNLKDSGESLKKHADTISVLKTAQNDANKAYKQSKENTDALKQAMNAANAEYNRNLSNVKYCEEHQELYTRQLTESETELILLNNQLEENSNYLREAAASADRCATSIDGYGKNVKEAGEDTKSFADAADLLAKAIVASGAIEGAEKLKDAIVATAEASIAYESAFAGVRKTVDGTAEELDIISDGIKKMALEIPMAATEIAGIAENAGQLGIATKDILTFTETMAALGVTTNLSAEEASIALAKFANITNMSASEYGNLGSAIVALGNNFATTEADIVAMATRLASTGEVVGLTEAQILAVATALSSVGIEAEAGGTAFSKLLRNIATAVETGSDSVEEFAKIAGMSADEFARSWERDAVGAVAAFIKGLGGLKASGGSAISVLSDLGLEEQRLVNSVLALASSEDILSKALSLSNTAWAENTALAEEAAIRYETTESKLQLLNNAFENLKITMGDQLTEAIGEPLESLTDFVGGLDEFIQKYPAITSALAGLAAGFGTLAVVGTVLPLVVSLGAALVALPHGAAIAGISALAAAIGGFVLTLPKATTEAERLAERIEALTDVQLRAAKSYTDLKSAHASQIAELKNEKAEIDKAIETLAEYGDKTNLSASETQILYKAIGKLNGSIPGLELSYENLNGTLEDVVYHLRLVAEAQSIVDEAVAKRTHIDDLSAKTDALKAKADNAKTSWQNAAAVYDELLKKHTEWGKEREYTVEDVFSYSSPYTIQLEVAKKAMDDARNLYDSAEKIRLDNAKSIDKLRSDINQLDKAYEEAAAKIKESNVDIFKDTDNTLEDTTDAFGKFLDSVVENGDKYSSKLSMFTSAFEAGFSVPLLQAINESSAESEKVISQMLARYNELVATYGEGSDEVRGFVESVNQTFADSAGQEDALIAGLKEIGVVVEETGSKTSSTAKATKESVEAAGQAIIEHAGTVKSNLQTLIKEYDSTYKSAKSSLGGIGGLFGEIAFESDKSISDMLSGLDAQADYFTGYMLNLKRAAQIGIHDGLVSELADGSKESAGYIQVIIDEFNKVAAKYGEGSEEAANFVKDFNSKFEATSKAKDALAATMAGIQTNFEERAGEILSEADQLIEELAGYGGKAYDEVALAVSDTLVEIANGFMSFQIAAQERSQGILDTALYIKEGINTTLDVLPEEMRVAGQNVSLGLTEGMLEKIDDVKNAVKKLAQEAILETAKEELGIHSPSEEGKSIGKFFDAGIAIGIGDGSDSVSSAAVKMIQQTEAQSKSAAVAAGTSLGNAMADSMAKALAAGQALRQQVEAGTLYIDGQKVQTGASVGLPTLSPEEAQKFNAEMKDFHNLPSDWSNQDIVDWLNGGGFMSSSTSGNVESALAGESALKESLIHTTNKNWHNSYINQLNANKAKESGTTVVVNQTFTGNTSAYEAGKAVEKAGEKLVYDYL